MLTRLTLETDSNCFKFSSIGGMAERAIPLDAHLMTGSDALTWAVASPVAIFFVFDFLERLEFCATISIGFPLFYR